MMSFFVTQARTLALTFMLDVALFCPGVNYDRDGDNDDHDGDNDDHDSNDDHDGDNDGHHGE